MTPVAATQTMTAREFLQLPMPERGKPWSLVEGEVVMNDPTALHMLTQLQLLNALQLWIQGEAGRGAVWLSVDVEIDDRNVYSPDLLWYPEGRAPHKRAERPYPLPDLAVEIRSASTWRYDIGAKKSGYERARLQELWLVDTAADAVLIFRRSAPGVSSFDLALELAGEQRLESPLLPGFSLALDELFGE